MTEHLASLFGTAVGMLPTAPARSLELFTEITAADETACDAWVGRLRCGDTDRATLFRAWYSRNNFGQLAGRAEISMNSVNARIPIGGLYGDITYPVNSPLAITMAFAVREAAEGNFADAIEALDDAPAMGAEYLVSWIRAVIYGAAERWTDVIDEVRAASGWPDKFLGAAAGVAHGVAVTNLGLFTEAERRLTESNASPAGEACDDPRQRESHLPAAYRTPSGQPSPLLGQVYGCADPLGSAFSDSSTRRAPVESAGDRGAVTVVERKIERP